MAIFNMQPVINILDELMDSDQLEAEQIDEAIDTLESIKSRIDPNDDEAIDKIDEIQDYLEYVLAIEESSMEETKEELADMINSLKKS